MSYWNQSMRSDDRREDKPPHSRVFVVCSKQCKEEDLRSPFEKYGTIEDIYIPRDRNSGESKGVAYIKYTKTSSAAAAIEELHMKPLKNESKPLKVMVAANKTDCNYSSEDRYNRLFIKVHREATENEIRDHFSAFGTIESVRLQRDKVTDACKGFAYVQYKNFTDAAKAFEECDRRYRAMFATPKDELKRSRINLEKESFHSSNSSISGRDNYLDRYHIPRDEGRRESINALMLSKPQDFNTISVVCSPQIPQRYIQRLFNIIPGMKDCQYSLDTYNGVCKALITYEDEKAASFAVERLNNYEFPSGEVITIKPNKNPLTKAATELSHIVNIFKNAIDSGTPNLLPLADAIEQASSLIKVVTTSRSDGVHDHDANYCSVDLPPPKPLVDSSHRVAQRCFIVCKPQPPPSAALKDVFSRFGDLINVSTFPNKTFGFAKYASIKSAQDAIRTLNGAIVCGSKLKVMEADERPNSTNEENKMKDDHNDNTDGDVDRKRMRLVDNSDLS